MVMNITNEELICVTLVIGDDYGSDVVAGHGGGATW